MVTKLERSLDKVKNIIEATPMLTKKLTSEV